MAYKFQLGAGLYSGSLEAVGEGKFTSGDFQDGNITNVGDIDADSISVADAANGLNIDGSGANTGTFKVTLKDAMADALNITEGSNSYLKFTTSNGSEAVTLGKTLTASAGIGANFGGALTVAGNVAGVDDLDGAGDLTMATITMTGFTVDADGDTALKSLAVDDGSTIGCDSDADLLTLADGALTVAGTLSGSGALSIGAGATLAGALNLQAGGITNAGAIAAATTISGSGALSVGAGATLAGALNLQGNALQNASTISGSGNANIGGTLAVGNSGFTVDADGDTVGKTLSASAGVSAGGASTFAGGVSLQASGLSAAGAIAGATTIDGTGDLTMGTITMTGFTVDADGDTAVKTLSSSATVTANALTVNYDALFSADVAMSGAADHAIVAADSILFIDVTSGKVRSDTFTDYGTFLASQANGGLNASSGKLIFDPNDLAAADVDVANDSIAIVDANASNQAKKESISDLVSAMAGAGLSANAGQLSVQGNAVNVIYSGVTASEGYNYIAAALTASHVVHLPASPSVGDFVAIKSHGSASASQYIQVQRLGSHLIDIDHTAVRLESPFASITLVYMAANDWRIV
jgi:hypothetical protein